MSKKHLEEIIDKWVYALESGRDGSYLSVEDVEYLIEQAERVEELEERVKEYEINIIENGVDIFKMTNEINALEVQNKRYREAIENIEKGYKRILSEQSTRLLTEQYTRVSNLKFIRDEIKALGG